MGKEDEQANVRLAFHAMAGGPDELKKIYEAGREGRRRAGAARPRGRGGASSSKPESKHYSNFLSRATRARKRSLRVINYLNE